MRKVMLAIAAVVAFGLAAPVATSSDANAQTVIIKKKSHHHGWHRAHARADRVVIIKKRGHGHYHHGRGHGYGHRHHMH